MITVARITTPAELDLSWLPRLAAGDVVAAVFITLLVLAALVVALAPLFIDANCLADELTADVVPTAAGHDVSTLTRKDS